VEIKTKQSFNDLLESLVEEILDEEELDEITTSGDAGSYMTPMAFDPEGENKKKSKKNSYRKKIGEALESKDIAIIKKLIRDVIADVYRDIWIKRGTWK
jgi:hypothetical protein